MRSEAEIFEEIRSQGNAVVRSLLKDLLNHRIERCRLSNDDAIGEAFLKNQGAIREFKRLLIEIETEIS